MSWLFKKRGIEIEWQGKGVAEKGIDIATGEVIVNIDPRYFRPTEVDLLLGDPSKAKAKLDWTPKISFRELVAMMVEEDISATEKDVLCHSHGYRINSRFE